MEDPKAWKPRKAWHLNVRRQGSRNPPLGRTGTEAMLPDGRVSGITMVWSRPWATENGMCWEASRRGLRESFRMRGGH